MTNPLCATGISLLAIAMAACASNSGQAPGEDKKDSAGGSFSFAVIGDIPYNNDQKWALKNNITPELKVYPFVVHVGDTKRGSNAPCTDALDEEHLNWMNAVGAPVFYTPGDNEWTDCDRASNTPVVRELLRLEKLRAKFFNPAPISPPQSWRAEWQATMPENASWIYENVRFVTIHLVGGNNGRDTLGPCESANPSDCDTPAAIAAAVAMRDSNNAAWVASAFAKARAENAAALVIATQGDVTAVRDAGKICATPGQADCDGYKEIRELIAAETAAFEKPVLFVHGDTSPYCWDRSFGGASAPNLWRLNAAGDYMLIDAVKIIVSPEASVPFQAEGIVSKLKPAENGCR